MSAELARYFPSKPRRYRTGLFQCWCPVSRINERRRLCVPDPSPSRPLRQRRPRPVIAIVGATGAVGNELLRILEERRFPVAELRLLASPRSAGKRLGFAGEELPVEAVSETALHGVDLALFSAGSGTALRWAPQAVRAGAVVIDNS